jgi:hypothetical protein
MACSSLQCLTWLYLISIIFPKKISCLNSQHFYQMDRVSLCYLFIKVIYIFAFVVRFYGSVYNGIIFLLSVTNL